MEMDLEHVMSALDGYPDFLMDEYTWDWGWRTPHRRLQRMQDLAERESEVAGDLCAW